MQCAWLFTTETQRCRETNWGVDVCHHEPAARARDLLFACSTEKQIPAPKPVALVLTIPKWKHVLCASTSLW